MASLAGPTNRCPPPFNRRTQTRNRHIPQPSNGNNGRNTLAVSERRLDLAKLKDVEARERKEETNRKIASQKAISIILRREATKAVIEKKKGNSKNCCPELFLKPFTSASPLCAGSLHSSDESLGVALFHGKTANLCYFTSNMRSSPLPDSNFHVFELLREQLWYRPNSGIYIKLIVMLGKCKQPEKAHTLFQAMIDEGCVVDREAYTALMSAYSRSGLFDKAFYILEKMKTISNCQPDVYTYSILIKSCLQVNDFGKVQSLLSDMEIQGIKPNTITYKHSPRCIWKSKEVHRDGIFTRANA
ncbi:UNVERIFIED_CONTAM: Pentatricopeptide repeat-containing protein, chloroplastic [Sesamum angustifolium]|uniref:Pentatricopeptide repeat-containing protein, chloroplastic n=1 Tax=Sesamum angustifolium TaxID=2727405 RepID=A0AAW2NPA4_9LAMI